MSSNRIRKHPAYQRGRDYADGVEPQGVQWVNTVDGENAFHAGYKDRKEELEREAENYRLATENISMLLYEAKAERDFDKLCIVIERLIDAQS